MLYDLKCECGETTEYLMGMNEIDLLVECPFCTKMISRKYHRVMNAPKLSGVHCAGYGGTPLDYYDETLEAYITDPNQKKDLMKKRGLTEYNPDPTMKRHRDEAKYIRASSAKGDLQASEAIRKEYKTAENKRRDRLVKASLEKSLASIVPD